MLQSTKAALDNKFMLILLPAPGCMHDKHANWTIIKPNNIHSHLPGHSEALLSTFHTFNSPFEHPFSGRRDDKPEWNWSPSRMLINIDWFLIVSQSEFLVDLSRVETSFEAQFQFQLRAEGTGKKDESPLKNAFGCVFYVLRRYSTNDRSRAERHNSRPVIVR